MNFRAIYRLRKWNYDIFSIHPSFRLLSVYRFKVEHAKKNREFFSMFSEQYIETDTLLIKVRAIVWLHPYLPMPPSHPSKLVPSKARDTLNIHLRHEKRNRTTDSWVFFNPMRSIASRGATHSQNYHFFSKNQSSM
jgi:hypothetical protein